MSTDPQVSATGCKEAEEDFPLRWQLAIDMQMAGAMTAKIAADLDINPATLWRWQQKPEYQARLAQERKERREALQAKILAGGDVAIKALVDVASGSENDAAKVAAAKAILDRIPGSESRSVVEVDPTGADGKAELARLNERIATLQAQLQPADDSG